MASKVASDQAKVVAQVRRVWGDEAVEVGSNGQSWAYRISCPDDHTRIQLHRTPSDRNWLRKVMGELDKHGFSEDLERQQEKEEELRAEEAKRHKAEAQRKLDIAQRNARNLVQAAGPYTAQVADPKWLFAKHEHPEIRRVLITPELAQLILDDYNPGNRPLRKGRVAYWATVMRKDGWKFTHQAMAFDVTGMLQDGQHRLAAAVQENMILDVWMAVGMPVENFPVIDVGAARSYADAYSTAGKKNANINSGATNLISRYDTYGKELRYGMAAKISQEESLTANDVYDKDGRLTWAMNKAEYIRRNVKAAPKMSTIALTAATFLISRNLPWDEKGQPDERVTEFLRGYAEGTNLPNGDARIPLRTFMENLTDAANKRVPVVNQLAVFILAWNLWVSGKASSIVTWRKNAMFPKVLVPKQDQRAYDDDELEVTIPV